MGDVGTILAEVLTLVVVVVGGVWLGDRLLWRRYWKRRGFEWSDERQALVKLGKVTKHGD